MVYVWTQRKLSSSGDAIPNDEPGVQRLLSLHRASSTFGRCHKALKRVNTKGDSLDLGATSAEGSRHPEANGHQHNSVALLFTL